MYPNKKREKAIELLIKYDYSIAGVIAELGYPSRAALKLWRKQYLQEKETGWARERTRRKPRFTPEQKQVAIEHCLEHGRQAVLSSGMGKGANKRRSPEEANLEPLKESFITDCRREMCLAASK